MHTWGDRFRAVVGAATLGLLLLAYAPPVWAARWVRLRAPHFVLVGDVRESQLREVAQRLEGF